MGYPLGREFYLKWAACFLGFSIATGIFGVVELFFGRMDRAAILIGAALFYWLLSLRFRRRAPSQIPEVLIQKAKDYMRPCDIGKWWLTPSGSLGGRSPQILVTERGEAGIQEFLTEFRQLQVGEPS